MLQKKSPHSNVLIITPKYFPEVCWRSFLTKSLERSLDALDIETDIFVWSSTKELINLNLTKEYKYVLHLDSASHKAFSSYNSKNIFFITTFDSSFGVKGGLNHFHKKAFYNIFESEGLFQKFFERMGQPDYSRDLVFQSCLDLENSEFVKTPLIMPVKEDFLFIYNDGATQEVTQVYSICKWIAKSTMRTVKLIGNCDFESGDLVKVVSLNGMKEEERSHLLKKCHFNLLTKTDISFKTGSQKFPRYFSILKAASYGVPSLVAKELQLEEFCHQGDLGLNIFFNEKSIKNFFDNLTPDSYQSMRKMAYGHVTLSHRDELYQGLFSFILNNKGAI